MVKSLFINSMMKLGVLINKLVVGGEWYVGYRDYTVTAEKDYKLVMVPQGQWIADPFLYEFEGKHYLFAEQYFKEKHRAGIGVYEIIDGKPVNNRIIIENDYHMSYPCVFYYKGNHYMIPESSANNSIDLYMAEEFPYTWKHKVTLLKGEKYVDSTVFQSGEELFLLTYKKVEGGWSLVLFSLDMEKYILNLLSDKFYETNTGRPAGFIYKKDKFLRPSQDCSIKYGEAIIINEIDELTTNSFQEHPVSRITHNDMRCPLKIQRVHTINRDSKYEVVDLFKEKIDLLHAFKTIKRKYNL